MVSRHFYEIDEVFAALRWCMRQGRCKEALFWSVELLESELEERLREELYKNWLHLFGISCLSALFLLQEEDSLGTVYALTRLPKERRDRSTLALVLLGASDTEQPDRASWFPSLDFLFEEKECSLLERAFLSSVYQGKSRLAFDLSRPLWQKNPTRVFDLLHTLQLKKHNNSTLAECLTLLELQSVEPWLTRACAIAAVCLDKKRLAASLQPLQPQLPSEILESLTEWRGLVGRRKRRIYSIPQECLYSLTKRGCLSNKVSTLSNLYNISSETLDGCPFWNRVIEDEVPWLDDDRKESFYEQYFPDDIPDEWSKQDQEKSHGWGSLINQEVLSNTKYLDRWYRDFPTRAYWFLNRDMQKQAEKNWAALLEKPWAETVSTWCLIPVKRRFLVLEGET